jgi:hypothetical protein
MSRRIVPLPTVAAAVTAAVMVAAAGFVFSLGETPVLVIRLAELTLAGGAAYLVDDPAAPVTGSSPQSLWRRRAPGFLGGGAVLAASWLAIVVLLRLQDFGPTLRLVPELGGLLGLAVAVAAVRFSRGDAEPGNGVATAVLVLGLAVMWSEWITGRRIFVPPEGPASPQLLLWLTALLAACVVAVTASREPRSR